MEVFRGGSRSFCPKGVALTLGIAESIGACLQNSPTGELASNLKLSHQRY